MPTGARDAIRNGILQSDLDANGFKINNLSGGGLPSPTQTGLTRSIWISIRTDGVAGDGSITSPFDGGTAVKLAAIFAALGSTQNIHFHLGPGTFQINFANAAGRGITVTSGWIIEGAGESVTTIQAIGNLAGIHYGCVIIGSDFNVSTDSVTVKNITLDCNWSGIGASADTGAGGEKNVKTGGVGIWGNNNLVEHVHVINSYGSLANTNERFDIALLGPTTANGSNNTIRLCNCELPQGTYGAPYLLAGSGGFVLSNSSVENCKAYGINNGGNSGYNTGGVNLAYINKVTIALNEFVDCGMIAYQDTGSFDGLFVYNNTLERGLVGISVGVVANNQKHLVWTNNIIGLQNRIFGNAVYGIVINNLTTTDVMVSGNVITYQSDGTGLNDMHNCLVANITDASFDNNILWDGDNQVPYDPKTFGTNVNSTNNLTRSGSPGISGAAPVNSKDNDLVGSLRISGTLGSGGAGIRFSKAHVFTVASGQTLQYEVYCDDTSPAFVPSVYLRDSGFGYAPTTYDQNNIDSTLGDVSRFAKGKWYHREINLTPIAGFAAAYLYYGLESSTIAGNYIYYFRNIRLVNSSGVTLFNYWTPEVQTADAGQDIVNATSVKNTPYFLNSVSGTPFEIAVFSSGNDGSGNHALFDDGTYKAVAGYGSEILSKSFGGTGTSSPALVAGSNITITGTWPNNTIAAAGGGGGGTITSFSFNNANGVIGSVANPSTTPALSIKLGDASDTTKTGTFSLAGKTTSSNSSIVVPDGTLVIPVGSAAPSNQFATGINATTGVVSYAQPTFPNLSGQATSTQIGNVTSNLSFSSTITPSIGTLGLNTTIGIAALTGNLTLNAPSGTPADAQKLSFRFVQDATGGRTITFDPIYAFGTDVTTAMVPTAASSKWEMLFGYNLVDTKWRCIGIARGF